MTGPRRFWPGEPYPLGATWDGAGVNFALFSERATGVELCLFDHPAASQPVERLPLRERTDLVWHGYDGIQDNLSWNCGVEGPTEDPAVRALRARQARNFLATLFLSQGIPMLCGGDEIGRTQGGNNNAYCQDNETSWYDWALDDGRRALLDFTRRLVRLRREHPGLRRRKFFQGRPLCQEGMKDLAWLTPGGTELTEVEWRAATLRAFGLRLCGDAMDDVDERGLPVTADTLLVLFNAEPEPVSFVLPDGHHGALWETLLTRPPRRRRPPVIPPAGRSC